MTSSQHNDNYVANSARLIGYSKGFLLAWIDELDRKTSTENVDIKYLKFLRDRMQEHIEFTDKWWELRYDGPFRSNEINNQNKEK